MIATIIVSILCTLFGKQVLKKIWISSKITVDEISREEAVLILMERNVVFKWRPQIVDEEIISNVVDIKNIKKRKIQ